MKQALIIILSIALAFSGTAQKGSTQIGIGAEIGLPTGEFGSEDGGAKAGFGGYIKGLFGVSDAGQITVTTGYTSFTIKGSTSSLKASISIIPILIGYRHNFNGFYIEPQAGVGIYGARVTFQGESGSSSQNKLTLAAGVGYAKNSIDIGVRYQTGVIKQSPDLTLVAVRFGYNFLVGKSKK